MNTRNRRSTTQRYTKRPRAHITPSFPSTSSSSSSSTNGPVNPKRSKHNVVKLFQHLDLGDGIFRATGNVDIFKTRSFLERRKKASLSEDNACDPNNIVNTKIENLKKESMCRIALIEKKLKEKYSIGKNKYAKDIYRVFNRMHERLSNKLDENRKANTQVDLIEGMRKFKKIFKINERDSFFELAKKSLKDGTLSVRPFIKEVVFTEYHESFENCSKNHNQNNFCEEENNNYGDVYDGDDEGEGGNNNDNDYYEELDDDVYYAQFLNVPFYKEKEFPIVIDLQGSEYNNY